MPNFANEKICGYYLYLTSHCVIEAMHAHASKDHRESGSAKFWVRSDGSVVISKTGNIPASKLNKIAHYIEKNYKQMYDLWSKYSDQGFYNESCDSAEESDYIDDLIDRMNDGLD